MLWDRGLQRREDTDTGSKWFIMGADADDDGDSASGIGTEALAHIGQTNLSKCVCSKSLNLWRKRAINVCIYLRCRCATCEWTIKAAYAPLNSHATSSRSTGSMALHQHNRLTPSMIQCLRSRRTSMPDNLREIWSFGTCCKTLNNIKIAHYYFRNIKQGMEIIININYAARHISCYTTHNKSALPPLLHLI